MSRRVDAPGPSGAQSDQGWSSDEHGFERLPVTFPHAERAGTLPPHHRDPFDRMLVAQALEEHLTLVTRDAALAAYDVPILPV